MSCLPIRHMSNKFKFLQIFLGICLPIGFSPFLYAQTTPQNLQAALSKLQSPNPQEISAVANSLAVFPYQETENALIQLIHLQLGRGSNELNTYIISACLKSLSQIGTQRISPALQQLTQKFQLLPTSEKLSEKTKLFIQAAFFKAQASLGARSQVLPRVHQVIHSDPKRPHSSLSHQAQDRDRGFTTNSSYTEPSTNISASRGQASLSEEFLSRELAQRMTQIRELRFIQEQARRLGISHVYLLGGSAATYGHYVRQDLLRLAGDTRYQAEHFDYEMTTLFSSTQDVDIVVDGTFEQIQQLEQIVVENHPLSNNEGKSAWEFRSLRENLGGTKIALLGNPDYLNQNNDSVSLGMIEITRSGDPVVRSLSHWGETEAPFLKDLAAGRIRYHNSSAHESTSAFRNGRNPKIVSVLRYLTKVSQFDLEMHPEDIPTVQMIINEFDPSRVQDEALYAIEKNGKKIFTSSQDVEKAMELLTRFHLKNKLIAVKNDFQVIGSLAWWMSKEPLQSFQVGTGTGRTAQEMDLTVVAHETREFMALEAITRNRKGVPNVFKSRATGSGEAAVLGDGFYTKKGRTGGIGTGLTVRFEIDPNAREGTDFTYFENLGYLVFENKLAFRVIPESLQLNLVEYLKLAMSLSESEYGVFEKLGRRFTNGSIAPTPAEETEAVRLIKMNPKNERLAQAWFQLKMSAKYPELPEALIQSGTMSSEVANTLLSQRHWKIPAEWVESLIRQGDMDWIIAIHVLAQPQWKNHPEWVETLIRKGTANYQIIRYVLSQPHSKDHPEWIEEMIRQMPVSDWGLVEIMNKALSELHWKAHPVLRQLTGGQDPRVGNLKTAFNAGLSVRNYSRGAGASSCQNVFKH